MDKWNNWYKELNKNNLTSFRYGDTVTYAMGFNFLKLCSSIEDWGCGTGGFKRFFNSDTNCKYIGIDGSITPFSDIKADLVNYRSNVDGIFMRHVLEHNYNWDIILDNACKSFKKKFYLVLFTPFSEKTKQISHNEAYGVDVPDISFKIEDITNIITKNNCEYKMETIKTDTGYGIEHVFYIKKKYNLAYYTAYIGNNLNEACKIPPIPSDIYDCYYYTNNPLIYEKLKKTSWIPRFVEMEMTDDSTKSNFLFKSFKTCPHNYEDLIKYDYLIYMDSKLGKINEDVIFNILNNEMNNYDMILREHPFIQNKVLDEFHESMKQQRYFVQKEQIENYINKQLGLGLKDTISEHAACGFVIRKMNENTKKIGEEWLKHIQECGIQDQISFFFVRQLFHGIKTVNLDIFKVKMLWGF
jgi:hypothetical protein